MTPRRQTAPLAACLALALPAVVLSACAPAGSGGGGGFTATPGRMPAFCAANASRRFGVDLMQIHTGPAIQGAQGYAVNGSFRLSSGDSLEFACNFGSDGRYTGIVGR